MKLSNNQVLYIDINRHVIFGKNNSMNYLPKFIQGDSNILECHILYNDEIADLSSVGKIIVNFKRQDRKIISRQLPFEGNVISYKLGRDEVEKDGQAELEFQFFSEDGNYQISTLKFNIMITTSIGASFIRDEADDITILQELFIKAYNSIEKGDYAIAQGDYAKEQAKIAEAKIEDINKVKSDVLDVKSDAEVQANFAKEQAEKASSEIDTLRALKSEVNQVKNVTSVTKDETDNIAQVAQEKGDYAKQQGDYSKTQGDFAKAEGNAAKNNNSAFTQNEAERNNAENIRKTNETSRNDAEVIRKTNEDARKTQEQTRKDNETARQQNESTRQQNETNRETAFNQKLQSVDNSLNNKLGQYDNNVNNKLTQYDTDVKNVMDKAKSDTDAASLKANNAADNANSKASYAQQQGDIAQQKGLAADIKSEEALTKSNSALSKADEALTKSNSADSKSTTTNQRLDNLVANTGNSNTEIVDGRLGSDGTVHANIGAHLRNIGKEVNKAARQTQTLQNGTSVISSEYNAPLDIQIEGRTLINMGNTDLKDGSYYVLADKKTKVKTYKDDSWKQGVVKFQCENTLLTKADFKGKVSGSVVENPHIAKHLHSTSSFKPPTEYTAESLHYPAISVLENIRAVTGNMSQPSGAFASQVFSFNVIEHIERKVGLIPKTTIADKVQWIKDNVYLLQFNWWGKGSGPNGNKATISRFRFGSKNQWESNQGGNVNSTDSIAKLFYSIGSLFEEFLDTNGFVHFLAYADPSDGTTSSTIETDYVELEVTLKSTAQLNKKPIFSRVANFEGKNDNPSAVPHYFRTTSGGTGAKTLQTTDSAMWVNRDSMTSTVERLNGVSFMNNTIVAEAISQQIFSFNIIEEVERNICKIPGNSTIEKVNWLKLNLNKYVFNWYGYGGGPSGNKVYIKRWIGSWFGETSHSSSIVSKLQSGTATPSSELPTDGIVHFLAFADPSDGVKDSYVYTDYAELEIEFKPDVKINNPIVPLYEVSKNEYDQILIGWNEAEVLNRYPRIQGMQHLQNPAIIAEGENLLPPFYEWSLHPNSKVINPYEFEITSTARYQSNTLLITAYPNTTYTMNIENLSDKIGVSITSRDIFNNNLEVSVNTIFHTPKTFTTPSKTALIHINLFNYAPENGVFLFKNPTLSLGKPKPFTPKNPSYLFAQVKLGQIGDKKDTLYKENGEWKVRKEIEKDVSLDSSLNYILNGTVESLREIGLPANFSATDAMIINPKNYQLNKNPLATSVLRIKDNYRVFPSTGVIYISVSDDDSGWKPAYSPTSSDIKRYFNGWKYTDGTTWTSVTGNGQTATAETALTTKPTDYTPYKLSYALATPKIEAVNDMVEGDITLAGNTQVEVTSGIVVREKTIPILYNNSYYINNIAANKPKYLDNKLDKVLGVYKNGVKDNQWIISTTNGYGNFHLQIPKELFDTSAEYTVTYSVLEKDKFTSNAVNLKAIFANSIRSALDDSVKKVEDIKTEVSVNTRLIYEMLKRMKAGGI